MSQPSQPPTLSIPLSDAKRWRAYWVCVAVAGLTILDLTKVNVALPSIEAAFGATSTELQLIVSGYVLTFGLTLVPAGRIGDQRSRRTLFVIGLSLFTLTSLACALAPNGEVLLVARLLQGVAAGIQMPQVLGLIQQLFQGAERGKAFGLFGATIGVATAFGPTLGGLAIAIGGPEDGWRGIFWMNVPLVARGDRARPLAAARDAPSLLAQARARPDRPAAVRHHRRRADVAVPLHHGLARRQPRAVVAARRVRVRGERVRRVGTALRGVRQAPARAARAVRRELLSQRHRARLGVLRRRALDVPAHDAVPAARARPGAGVRGHGEHRIRAHERRVVVDRRQPGEPPGPPPRGVGPRDGAASASDCSCSRRSTPRPSSRRGRWRARWSSPASAAVSSSRRTRRSPSRTSRSSRAASPGRSASSGSGSARRSAPPWRCRCSTPRSTARRVPPTRMTSRSTRTRTASG